MQAVTYVTEKEYPDGTKRVILKNGVIKSDKEKGIERAERFFKELKNEQHFEDLTKRLNELTMLPEHEIERKKVLNELRYLEDRKIENVLRASRRTQNELSDLVKCNDFDYFVTFTLGDRKIRYNYDESVKAFSRWAHNVKMQFPDMYYIAVIEHHGDGAYHFHIVIGGISFEALKCEFWKSQKKGKHKGQAIYKVNGWKNGYSTLTVIQDKAACQNYILKYISKQDRFYNDFFRKKRYYASRNLKKPTVNKAVFERKKFDMFLDFDLTNYRVDYFDSKKQYAALTKLKPEEPRNENKMLVEYNNMELWYYDYKQHIETIFNYSGQRQAEEDYYKRVAARKEFERQYYDIWA